MKKRIFDGYRLFNFQGDTRGLLAWFCKRFLDHIPYPADWILRTREMQNDAIVAYAHRSRSSLLHLALRRMIGQHSLPQIMASAFDKRQNPTFSHVVQTGQGAVEFFLRQPRTVMGRGKRYPDYIRTLIHLQRQHDRPIIIVPHILMLGSRPHQKQPTATDMIFGTRQEPGFLRMLARIVLCHRWAKWLIAEPLNLKSFIDEHPYQSDENLARQVRWSLTKRLNALERSYFGPALKSHSRIRFDTLRDKDLQEFVGKIEEQTGVPKAKLQKKAKAYYHEIAARFDIDFIRLIDKVLSLIWNRIYDGLMWDAADIDKLRAASQKGPLIIVPSHKSHVDYLVMSQILFWEGLMLPHIAAGANLSFFPLGTLFRRGGAYFIRRSFRGDPLYPQVVRAYIKRLLKESFTQEFFIEGGRSRTGKTLPPKLGLLSIIVDCLMKGKLQEAMFVPASISYEKLVEANEYRRELEGGEKAVENTKSLLGSTHVLKKRYGCVYVTFDEPISFIDFLKERGITDGNIDENTKNDIVKSLAHRAVFGMNQCAVITPTSLIAVALVGSNRRTLSYAQLMWRIKKLVHYIQESNLHSIRFSDEFKQQLRKPVKRAIELLITDNVLRAEEAGGSTYYRVPEVSALSLDYYKNNVLHHFVADAIIATAFIALSGKNRRKKVSKSALEKVTQTFSQIFKYEFIYPVGIPFKDLFAARLKRAVEQGIVILSGDHLWLSESRDANLQINFAIRLLANFVDAYWICMQKFSMALKKATTDKALVMQLLEYLREAHISGVSDCPEIVSKSLPENTLLLMRDYGAIRWENGVPALGDREGIAKLELAARILQKAHYNR